MMGPDDTIMITFTDQSRLFSHQPLFKGSSSYLLALRPLFTPDCTHTHPHPQISQALEPVADLDSALHKPIFRHDAECVVVDNGQGRDLRVT